MRPSLAEQLGMVLLIGMFFLLPAFAAASNQPGIPVGDWATYSESLVKSGNDLSLISPFPGQSMTSTTDTATLNVTGISNSIITIMTTAHYDDPSPSTVDVSQGWGTVGPQFIIAGQLQMNGPLGSGFTAYLNDTSIQTLNMYPIGSDSTVPIYRSINTLKLSSVTLSQDESYNSTFKATYRWDQITGTPVSFFVQRWVTNTTSVPRTASFSYALSIRRTNIWPVEIPKSPPGMTTNPPGGNSTSSFSLFGLGFTELYVLVGIAGALAMGVVAVLWRRSPKNRGSPQKSRRQSIREPSRKRSRVP